MSHCQSLVGQSNSILLPENRQSKSLTLLLLLLDIDFPWKWVLYPIKKGRNSPLIRTNKKVCKNYFKNKNCSFKSSFKRR